jgi:VanZ family protein
LVDFHVADPRVPDFAAKPFVRFLWSWGPPLVWMAATFVASHQSAVEIPFGAPDYVGHALGYSGLGALLMRALAGGTLRNMRAALIVPAALIAIAYGFTDEFHQSFIPGRMASWSDIVADAVGALAGASGAALLAALLGRRQV